MDGNVSDDSKPPSLEPADRDVSPPRFAANVQISPPRILEDSRSSPPSLEPADRNVSPLRISAMFQLSPPRILEDCRTSTDDSELSSTIKPTKQTLPAKNCKSKRTKKPISSDKKEGKQLQCKKKTPEEMALETDSVEKPYACSNCGSRFRRLSYLASHELYFSRGKLFSCGICNRSFRKSFDLKTHERIHTGEKLFSCSVCEKKFTQRSTVRAHEKTHFKTAEKAFKCGLCVKGFDDKHALKRHENTHTKGKQLPCSYCGMQFNHISALKAHNKDFHTGLKPYKCCVCNKMFRRLCELRNHETSHHNGKPFSCSDCDLTFRSGDELRSHREVTCTDATDHKQFSCINCDLKFPTVNALLFHEKTHMIGDYLLCYSYCSRRFLLKSELRSHEATHEKVHCPEKPYACNYCDSRFWQIAALRAHERIQHDFNSNGTTKTEHDPLESPIIPDVKPFANVPDERYNSSEEPVYCDAKPFPSNQCDFPCNNSDSEEKPFLSVPAENFILSETANDGTKTADSYRESLSLFEADIKPFS